MEKIWSWLKKIWYRVLYGRPTQAAWPKKIFVVPSVKEPPKAKEFVRPEDPYFRFGSSYLSRLKSAEKC